MDKINSLFTIGNVNEDNAQKIFTDIATELFEHCFIKQGEAVKYKFLEVEFYFWSEAHKDNKLDNEGKKKCLLSTHVIILSLRNTWYMLAVWIFASNPIMAMVAY